MAPMAMAPDGALDAAWLASRRWFRHKTQAIESVSVEDSAALGTGCVLQVMAARLATGELVRYFVPARVADGAVREPEDGEGAWRGLVGWLLNGRPVPTEHGSFVPHSTAEMNRLLPGGSAEAAGLEEHRLGAQQSNSSVRLGERLILKLYRFAEPGTNPEVEVCAFLGEAGFRHVPPVAGWIEYCPADGPPAATAMLQELVPARGDGWSWMLDRLGAQPRGPAEALAAVAQIGGVTAELHAALRSRPAAPGFEAGPATPADLERWRAVALGQLDGALSAVAADDRQLLQRVAAEARDALDAIPDATSAISSRIHGDYHLGQLLATEGGFVVIDFEGEPARPLEERRRPASPLRDVASMLRSLDYAARTAETAAGGADLSAWLADARDAFLAAYGDAPDAKLLRAFEIEKACYEIRYEANNRPDWAWLPLQALQRLVA
jgi:trehalose synthase-fused probable maltokinase